MLKLKLGIAIGLKMLLVLVSFFLIQGCGKKDDSGKTDGKTENKSSGDIGDFSPDKPFHVEFDITGDFTGKINAYYHNKKARIENTMIMKGQKIVSTSYSDGNTVYIISEIAGIKTGMKMDSKKYSEESGKNDGQVDITSFKDHLKDYDKVGTEEILGKTCDIYKSKDGKFKISVYKETIPLKFDMGKIVFTATKVEMNPKISDDMFTPPSDVKYTDMKDFNPSKDKMKDFEDKMKEMEDAMKKYNK